MTLTHPTRRCPLGSPPRLCDGDHTAEDDACESPAADIDGWAVSIKHGSDGTTVALADPDDRLTSMPDPALELGTAFRLGWALIRTSTRGLLIRLTRRLRQSHATPSGHSMQLHGGASS